MESFALGRITSVLKIYQNFIKIQNQLLNPKGLATINTKRHENAMQ